MTIRRAERNSAVNPQLNRLDQKFSEFLILNTNSLSTFTVFCTREYVLDNSTQLQQIWWYHRMVIITNGIRYDETQAITTLSILTFLKGSIQCLSFHFLLN